MPGLHHRLLVLVGSKLDEDRPVSVQPTGSHFSHAVASVDGVVWECDTSGLGDRLDNVVCALRGNLKLEATPGKDVCVESDTDNSTPLLDTGHTMASVSLSSRT